jgi:hypothetical protein
MVTALGAYPPMRMHLLGHFWGLIFVLPVTTARNLKFGKRSWPTGRRALGIQKISREREKGTNGRASIKWPPKGKSRRKAAAMITFVLFASRRSHLRSGVIRSHSWDLIGFHLGKACFDVNFSRYESRLSPSIRRRPRLLPGQVTTTLEIKPASISL